MNCRPHCGACCIAPSITSPIPGMPQGKPAGVRCVQLDDENRCRIFGQPERPAFCASLKASAEMCGNSREQAMQWLTALERLTAPLVAAETRIPLEVLRSQDAPVESVQRGD
jgi:Fe-S-cluster containining protein